MTTSNDPVLPPGLSKVTLESSPPGPVPDSDQYHHPLDPSDLSDPDPDSSYAAASLEVLLTSTSNINLSCVSDPIKHDPLGQSNEDTSSRYSASSLQLDDIGKPIPLASSNDENPYIVEDPLLNHQRSDSDTSYWHSASSVRASGTDEEIPLTSFSNDGAYYLKDHSNINTSSEFMITTGWNLKLAMLLLHGLVSTCWGIALFIFSLGIVPIDWNLSEGAKDSKYGQAITNTLVALVAAISTMHLTFIVQQIIQQYAHCLMVDGFTLGQLRYMQGIQEMSIFTAFPPRERGWTIVRFFSNRRLVWIVVYAGITFHTSSLVAILQPQVMIKNVMFNDKIPCGSELSNLTLGAQPFLNDVKQRLIDQFSYNVGIQLGNYGDQVNSNITTAVAGRRYTKDYYAYGAVGGLKEGLQEIPGVLFSARCSDFAANYTSIWQEAFPDRSPPLVDTLKNGSRSFVDMPVPAPTKIVVTDNGPFNVNNTHTAMYALVDPSGSGAFFSIASFTDLWEVDSESSLVCSWTTSPKIIHAQIVNFTARVVDAKDANVYPPLVGRATLMTLQGMADASRLGASLILTTYNPGTVTEYDDIKRPSQILRTLLADGGKAGYSFFNRLGSQNRLGSLTLCASNNRTVAEHWRFGNSQNLGWVATIWTTAIGIFAIVATFLLLRRKRMENVEVLMAAEAFALGRGNAVTDNELLCVRYGRVVRVEDVTR